ncbi:hypothetical protein HY249_02195 [Candidatus Azambacteria bacterium]|nr:hypothetical protein [Candidatus Azambacteria bacterium]
MRKINLFLVLFFSFAVFSAASAQAANLADGDLIKTVDNPDVYIVKIIGAKKFKRLILNPDIFNSYGHLKWENIKTVAQSERDQFKSSDLVIEVNSDGSVANPKVFRVNAAPNSDAGERRWLNLTAGEFEQEGFDWDSIYYVNHTEASKDFYSEQAELDLLDIENEKKEAEKASETPAIPETTATTTQGTTATTTPAVSYKTSITVSKRFDSPSGLANAGTGAVIGKFIIHNDLNTGDYIAAIKNIAISLSGTLSALDGRTLHIYKDSVSNSNLLATYVYPNGSSTISSSAIAEADFTDINVLSNSDKTFVVTLDTQGAVYGNSLTVGVGSVTWSDGITNLIESNNTPVELGVLSY